MKNKGTNAVVTSILSDNEISRELDVKYIEDDVRIIIAKKSKEDETSMAAPHWIVSLFLEN